jgi:potassium-transporting ATPase potassium-binding subunit
VIAQGQVASQEVIKMMGTNGGGFFNASSAHPYENPNALTNLVQMVLIFSIGASLTNVFGRTVGKERQGWAIFAVMAFCSWPEHSRQPRAAAFSSSSRC